MVTIEIGINCNHVAQQFALHPASIALPSRWCLWFLFATHKSPRENENELVSMLGYSQTAQICRNVHMVTSSVLYVQVQVQVLTPQVLVWVQVLQNCTRVQLEYKYKYQVLHLWLQMKNTTQKTQSALEALCDYALYKSTFTLHYITLQGNWTFQPLDVSATGRFGSWSFRPHAGHFGIAKDVSAPLSRFSHSTYKQSKAARWFSQQITFLR